MLQLVIKGIEAGWYTTHEDIVALTLLLQVLHFLVLGHVVSQVGKRIGHSRRKLAHFYESIEL